MSQPLHTDATCLFCKIVSGEIPSSKAYEDDQVYAFRDIHPAAPQHVLVIPKEHVATVNGLEARHEALAGKLILTAQRIARELGIADAGYRLVFNVNPDGGQTVYHLHLHILGGRQMSWPPG